MTTKQLLQKATFTNSVSALENYLDKLIGKKVMYKKKEYKVESVGDYFYRTLNIVNKNGILIVDIEIMELD